MCYEFRLPNGQLWPIPIYFDVTKEQAVQIEKSGIVEILDFQNRTKGYIHVKDVYAADHEFEHR